MDKNRQTIAVTLGLHFVARVNNHWMINTAHLHTSLISFSTYASISFLSAL